MLSSEEEFDLVEYIKEMDRAFYGLPINELRKVVYEYAVLQKIKHPFNTDKKLAGRDFVETFLYEHGVSATDNLDTVCFR